MPTEEQEKTILWPSFESVYESLVGLIELTPEYNQFPKQKLRNRLINIGLKEFLDGVEDGTDERRALEVFGFPFKFVTQLDEAILTLASFLRRFTEEANSSLHLYALHLLSKGEEKNLAFWQSPKAKLYIELQNIVLLLNGVGGRESSITRIFTFSKVEDIGFLTQPAIGVLSEQLAARIEIGLLFSESFRNVPKVPITNTVVIEFIPNPKSGGSPQEKKHRYNFYALRGILDETKPHNLPYQDRCKAKWFTNREQAYRSEENLDHLIENIFDTRKWAPISPKPGGICRFHEKENAFFNSATLMMFRAFTRGETNIKDEDFVDRVNQTVITKDLIRLERAIATFDDPASSIIKAVDATSVKDSLRIHESNPTYRHWLRTSLNRVLASKDRRLERLYILRDDHNEKPVTDTEFQTLLRELQYYVDYINYEIWEMTDILRVHEMHPVPRDNKKEGSLERKCKTFKNRIHVYVTTSTILEEFAPRTLDSDIHPEMLNEILGKPLSQVESEDIASTGKRLTELDYLVTEGTQAMIYNFLNQRADPGELKFDAYLYRNSFNKKREKSLLFDFVKIDDTFDRWKALRRLQVRNRILAFIESIRDYDKQYSDILNETLLEDYRQVKSRLDDLERNDRFDDNDQLELLDIRRVYETALYRHFAPRFQHLYKLLRYQSLQVEFFLEPRQRLIQQVKPFDVCKTSEQLANRIRAKISSSRTGPPKFSEGGDSTIPDARRGKKKP